MKANFLLKPWDASCLIALSLFLIFPSCRNEILPVDTSNIETIKVPVGDVKPKINFQDHFSSWKVIPLQTTKESLIGNVKRIYLYKSNYYILDSQTNSVLVFGLDGKYLLKIHNIGHGQGEYLELMDFTIDEANEHIIIYSHRPYKLLFFDMNGEFIKEQRMDRLYMSMSISGEELALINSKFKKGHMILLKGLKSNVDKEVLPMIKHSEYFQRFGIARPAILKSLKTFLSFPYSDTIYQITDDLVQAKYAIDFGKKKWPTKFIEQRMPPGEIFKKAVENDYGFGIGNFKELKDNIYFSYGPNTNVLYSKSTKESICFSGVNNNETYLEFGNIFAHDGNDNSLLMVYPATRYKRRMEYLKEQGRYEKLPEPIRSIDKIVSDISNPLLVVYNLK